MKRIILSIAFAMPFFANAMLHIKQKQLLVSEKLGALSLRKAEHGFTVLKGDVEQEVHSYDVDPVLRSLTAAQLVKALQASRIKVSQLGNGDYKLALQGELKGGGPVSGAIAYWLTKSVCYGTAVAGTGALVVATGGAAGALTGAIAAGSTLSAGAGATIVGGAIAGAGLTTEAALASTAILANTAGIAGAVAAVETAAVGAGVFFATIPFLP